MTIAKITNSLSCEGKIIKLPGQAGSFKKLIIETAPKSQ
jgi:hypothetical protein